MIFNKFFLLILHQKQTNDEKIKFTNKPTYFIIHSLDRLGLEYLSKYNILLIVNQLSLQ